MKVELLVSRSGPGLVQLRGEVVDVDKDEAARMIDAGQAVPVKAGRSKAKQPAAENTST